MFFDHEFRETVPMQQIDSELQKQGVLEVVRETACQQGGTMMYTALKHALQSMCPQASQDAETWIVCLTDGASADSIGIVQLEILGNPRNNLHVVVIGVGLSSCLHGNMKALCNKFANDPKGFFIPTTDTADGISEAFSSAASAIPVSQTFELDGELSDSDCRSLMSRFLPNSADPTNKLICSFWIKFLFRRVSVFDQSEDFNYNEEYDSLGSSLMEMMLSEAGELLLQQQNLEHYDGNRAQLVYDVSDKESPRFRLLCTSPTKLKPEKRQRLGELRLPGFSIPTDSELRRRSTLDRYLSQALCIPLQERKGRDVLACIDDNNFVLTLDFTVKLLNIHERIVCGVPCIVEGETGVSKTALTKMYSILINASQESEAKASSMQLLVVIEEQLRGTLGKSRDLFGSASDPFFLDGLHDLINELEPSHIQDVADFILDASKSRPSLFKDAPADLVELDCIEDIQSYVGWLAQSELESLFFDINVHSALDEGDVVAMFNKIQQRAEKCNKSTIVVFLDEINTAAIMGLMKEIVVDRSIRGRALRDNIVIVAACNPARARAAATSEESRESDLGKEWASGHYQVSPILGSMAEIMWQYGSLSSVQEKDFIFKRIDTLEVEMSTSVKSALTDYISNAQEALRSFAEDHIRERLKNADSTGELALEASTRAKSVVSLRDIQRVFSLFSFFLDNSDMVFETDDDEERCMQAALLSIAVVYYVRLDRASRNAFILLVGGKQGSRGNTIFLAVYHAAIDKVIQGTVLPSGTATTYGLKENLFLTVVCALSQTPLMIIGPPGCSKVSAHGRSWKVFFDHLGTHAILFKLYL
jgi:hypothetical protein